MPDFSLEDCRWIGFDLDHTLVRYKVDNVNRLIFEALVRYFVNIRGYDKRLADVPYDVDYAQKGLVFDVKYGTFIKLTADKKVSIAFRGVHHRLSQDDIDRLYAGGIPDFDGEKSARFSPFITYFDIPGLYVLALMVDRINDNPFPSKDGSSAAIVDTTLNTKLVYDEDKERRYNELRVQLGEAFFYNFSCNTGFYFSSIEEDTDRYVYKRPIVRRWLEWLRSGLSSSSNSSSSPANNENQSKGHRLFLVTNSKFDYANLLMNFSFGKDWLSLFDIVIVDSKKPRFFSPLQSDEPSPIPDTSASSKSSESPTTGQPFYLLDPTTEAAGALVARSPDTHELQLELGGIYVHGNSDELNGFFARVDEADGVAPDTTANGTDKGSASTAISCRSSVIYFGDHMRSDVCATATLTNWRAGAIVEELDLHLHADHFDTSTGLAKVRSRKRRRHQEAGSKEETREAGIVSTRQSGMNMMPSLMIPPSSRSGSGEADDDNLDPDRKYDKRKPSGRWGSFYTESVPVSADAPTLSKEMKSSSSSSSRSQSTYWSDYLEKHSDVTVSCLSIYATQRHLHSRKTSRGAKVSFGNSHHTNDSEE